MSEHDERAERAKRAREAGDDERNENRMERSRVEREYLRRMREAIIERPRGPIRSSVSENPHCWQRNFQRSENVRAADEEPLEPVVGRASLSRAG